MNQPSGSKNESNGRQLENSYRNALEKIVLELQSRANKAKFQLDVAKRSYDYADQRLKVYEDIFNQLQGAFNYAANIYNTLIENEYEGD